MDSGPWSQTAGTSPIYAHKNALPQLKLAKKLFYRAFLQCTRLFFYPEKELFRNTLKILTRNLNLTFINFVLF